MPKGASWRGIYYQLHPTVLEASGPKETTNGFVKSITETGENYSHTITVSLFIAYWNNVYLSMGSILSTDVLYCRVAT